MATLNNDKREQHMALQASTLFDARKLFDSIAAEVYGRSVIRQPREHAIVIRRKLDFHWNKRECERQAPRILKEITRQIDPCINAKRLAAMKPAEAIRAILREEMDNSEVATIMKPNRLFMSQEAINYF